jgi:TolB protein
LTVVIVFHISNGGPSIDASYQVSVHLAEEFQRRRLKCEKLTDDRRRTPSDGKNLVFTSNRSGQAQIYIKNLKTGHINRATFTGRYNAKAVSTDNKPFPSR